MWCLDLFILVKTINSITVFGQFVNTFFKKILFFMIMSIQKIIATKNQYIIYATIFNISSLNLASADIKPNIFLGFPFIFFTISSSLA